MPIVGLNSPRSKTNGTRGIKVSNLEASGHDFQLSKINHDDSDTFFLYLLIYSLSKSHYSDNTPKPPKLET